MLCAFYKAAVQRSYAQKGMGPDEEYSRRHEKAREASVMHGKRCDRLSLGRLLLACLGGLAWIILGLHAFFLVAAAFLVLVVIHQIELQKKQVADRRVSYYAENLERLADRWAGTGSTGDAYKPENHVYADDLDVFGEGSLFQFVSRARTAFGEVRLADWLLHFGDEHLIMARQEAVRELAPMVDLREDIALLGERVVSSGQGATLHTWAGAQSLARFGPGARSLAFALAVVGVVAACAALAHVWPSTVLITILLADFVFLFATREDVQRIEAGLEAPVGELRTLSRLLRRLERERFDGPYLTQLRALLDVRGVPASHRIARLRRWIELLDSSDHLILRVLGPLLLWKPQLVFAVDAWRREHGAHVAAWLESVAEFEALSSLAALHFERPAWGFPVITNDPVLLEGKGLCHPLLPAARCVPNDIRLDPSHALLIVSGSNMSGKSTWLRSVGLNAVLAGAGAPVAAKALTLPRIRLGTSIRVSDSLRDNKSRFFAEITRLRQIVDLTKDSAPVLFLLDELLSGTNSHDRSIGAAKIVAGLLRAGAFGIITTHDLALVSMADGLPGSNMHFEDEMRDGTLHFDYLLRAGVVTRSNALELMRAVGLLI